MTDVVVTVPLSFGLDTWIAEGDAAGEPWSGKDWECDEEGCLGRRDEICPACYSLRDLGLKAPAHSTWWVNRAKHEPAIAAKLQRLAALSAAYGSKKEESARA